MYIFNVNPEWIPGSIVGARTFGIFRHRGIVSDRWQNGLPMVISGSARRGQVVEESWDDFRQGQIVTLDAQSYPSQLPSYAVIARARSQIGAPYHLIDQNCEHLVRFAHNLPPKSPQVEATVALIGVALLVALAR